MRLDRDLYGFAFAHTVRIDKNDNIWATDEGTNMVIKFSPAGKVLMVLGRRPESVEAPGTPEPAPGTTAPVWGDSIVRRTSLGIWRATCSSPTATTARAS